jgi:hypothetical protein
MAELFTTAELVGHWLAIFLTFCILSFLYKDNPFYKFAEHLFVGVSIGYIVIQQYYSVLEPKLVDQLGDGRWLALIPLALCLMLLTKMVSRCRAGWPGWRASRSPSWSACTPASRSRRCRLTWARR